MNSTTTFDVEYTSEPPKINILEKKGWRGLVFEKWKFRTFSISTSEGLLTYMDTSGKKRGELSLCYDIKASILDPNEADGRENAFAVYGKRIFPSANGGPER